MYIVMTKLVSLEYRVNEDLHTISYKRDMESWLTHIAVANNFTPIGYVYEHITTEPITKDDIQPLVDAAKDKLIAKHIATLRQVFPEHTKVDRAYAEDFSFRFETLLAESGDHMKYMPFM